MQVKQKGIQRGTGCYIHSDLTRHGKCWKCVWILTCVLSTGCIYDTQGHCARWGWLSVLDIDAFLHFISILSQCPLFHFSSLYTPILHFLASTCYPFLITIFCFFCVTLHEDSLLYSKEACVPCVEWALKWVVKMLTYTTKWTTM